jgi:outer membrane protein assembly factor BamB
MKRGIVTALALGALVAGCGLFEEDEVILPGERVAVRAAQPDTVMPAARAAEISALGPARNLTDWTQPNGQADRAPGHVAGPAQLREAWRTSIGSGNSSAGRITAAPIVAGGRVFTLDAASTVAAVDAGSGRVAWRVSVTPEGQSARDGFGGGLATEDGRVFVTTGFGEVVALSANDGQVLWRQTLGAPLRAAPAVANGRVVAVTRDNGGFALDAQTGGILWRVVGARGGAGFLGGASPAIAGDVAVLPFTSGELAAVSAATGRRLWSDALTGGRRGSAGADIADISGDPVIAGPAVFASNFAGQMAGIDARTGQRGWLRPIRTTSPVWPVGATLFLASADGRVMRLSAATGETLWSTELPAYRRPDRRQDVISYRGPVVADGAVYVTSSQDGLLVFDAMTGQERSRVAISGGSTVPPVVAGGTLYVLSDNGNLHAFR